MHYNNSSIVRLAACGATWQVFPNNIREVRDGLRQLLVYMNFAQKLDNPTKKVHMNYE